MDVSVLDALGARTAPASNSPTALASVPSPSAQGHAAAKPYNPANPLFWYMTAAALTFGLAAFSTSVRVGHTTASLNLGSTS